MLKIRCSILEDVRNNPVAYAQLLALDDPKNGGGTHGMFAYWQDVAKLLHTNDLKSTSEAIKELQNKFMRFDDTIRNKAKQDKLLEQFVRYCKQYEKNAFAFVDTRRQMKWPIHANVMLTGLTPWVVYNDSGYYSYIVVEKSFDWQNELRFPLLQQYLVDNKIDCDISEMNIGIYCLETNRFEFKSYEKRELKEAVRQTTSIFDDVYAEYSRLTK